MHKKVSAIGVVVCPRLALGLTLVFARDAKGQCCALDLCFYGFAFYFFPIATLIQMEKLTPETPGRDESPYVQKLDGICIAHHHPLCIIGSRNCLHTDLALPYLAWSKAASLSLTVFLAQVLDPNRPPMSIFAALTKRFTCADLLPQFALIRHIPLLTEGFHTAYCSPSSIPQTPLSAQRTLIIPG
jgi:hypothetical protein